MARHRDYKEEYRRYHSRPDQMKKRAKRNAARTILTKKLGKAAVAGKHVDHKDRNANNNSSSNLRLRDPKKNLGDNK